MATLTLTNRGVNQRAKYLLNKDTPATLVLHLHNNNYTTIVTSTISNYTEPSGGTGYASVTLTPANWTGSASSGIATYDYPMIAFTFTSGGFTIYGVYIEDGTEVVMGGLLDTPFAVPSGGGTLNVYLEWVDKQCP